VKSTALHWIYRAFVLLNFRMPTVITHKHAERPPFIAATDVGARDADAASTNCCRRTPRRYLKAHGK
jgi:hypothetical protein